MNLIQSIEIYNKDLTDSITLPINKDIVKDHDIALNIITNKGLSEVDSNRELYWATTETTTIVQEDYDFILHSHGGCCFEFILDKEDLTRVFLHYTSDDKEVTVDFEHLYYLGKSLKELNGSNQYTIKAFICHYVFIEDTEDGKVLMGIFYDRKALAFMAEKINRN